jgi:hypothetical protein
MFEVKVLEGTPEDDGDWPGFGVTFPAPNRINKKNTTSHIVPL